MTKGGVFAVVALGSAIGAVAGAAAIGKKRGPMRQQPYAPIGAAVLATGVAAVAYKAPQCPPCAPGLVANGVVTSLPALSHGGYGAAVALASAIGGVVGAMAIGKQKSSKLLGQQPYSAIGAALAGAGAAAIFYPNAPSCPPCVAPTPPPAPSPNDGNGAPTGAPSPPR